MKRLLYIFIFVPLLIFSCKPQKGEVSAEDNVVSYDSGLHLLGVDFSKNPKESIDGIIHYSGIRKSGYGILLNIDKTMSTSEIDTIKMKFQLEDIGAIHSFDINGSDSIKNRVFVAIGGAQFIWIMNGSELNLSLLPLKSSLKKASTNKTLIVSGIPQMGGIKNLLHSD